jgi:hypothetical protein
LKDFEAGNRAPIANNRKAIQAALEREGIGFSFALDGDVKRGCGIIYSEPSKGNKTVDES